MTDVILIFAINCLSSPFMIFMIIAVALSLFIALTRKTKISKTAGFIVFAILLLAATRIAWDTSGAWAISKVLEPEDLKSIRVLSIKDESAFVDAKYAIEIQSKDQNIDEFLTTKGLNPPSGKSTAQFLFKFRDGHLGTLTVNRITPKSAGIVMFSPGN